MIDLILAISDRMLEAQIYVEPLPPRYNTHVMSAQVRPWWKTSACEVYLQEVFDRKHDATRDDS